MFQHTFSVSRYFDGDRFKFCERDGIEGGTLNAQINLLRKCIDCLEDIDEKLLYELEWSVEGADIDIDIEYWISLDLMEQERIINECVRRYGLEALFDLEEDSDSYWRDVQAEYENREPYLDE